MKKLFKLSFVFCLLSLVLASGCKKDKLKGKYSELIGTWRCVYIIDQSFLPPYSTYYDTIYPTENYYLEFKKKGVLVLKKENEIIDEVFLKIDDSANCPSNEYYCFKGTYNNKGLVFRGKEKINNDFFPYNEVNQNQYNAFYNFFVKID